ncbi:hypothetical protein CANCADRAFT_1356 [Tortispora caseinolytica NRRL Y-17796]|uniref:DNA helicase n=1 Tax=Tortispora caseinolytica NRRL Y-17796 TaxID=767744 RepID=A0A1E4TM00_9ASCO|nr:hypothetical protein CANCADRAFT_1356 [Tortispora caseinolytica NRRL Y-17796]
MANIYGDSPLIDSVKKYIYNVMTSKALAARTRDYVSVVSLGQSELKCEANEMPTPPQNVNVIMPIDVSSATYLQQIDSFLTIGENSADPLDDVIEYAITAMDTFCKHLKFKKSIKIFTDGNRPISSHAFDLFSSRLATSDIQLSLFLPEDADAYPQFTSLSGANIVNIHDAIAYLDVASIRSKAIRRMALADLTLGPPEYSEDLTNLRISVFLYPFTKTTKPPTATRYTVCPLPDVFKDQPGPQPVPTAKPGRFLEPVSSSVQYYIKKKDYPKDEPVDESIPCELRPDLVEVDSDSIAPGYRLGDSIIPMESRYKDLLEISTPVAIEIIAFVAKNELPRHFLMGEVRYVVPARNGTGKNLYVTEFDASAMVQLAAALISTDSVAIVRSVLTKNKSPKLACVFVPSSSTLEELPPHLMHCDLPHYNDFASFPFPDFSDILRTSSDSLKAKAKKFLPSTDLQTAMDNYVSAATIPQDSDYYDSLDPVALANPYIFRLQQAAMFRALNPDKDEDDLLTHVHAGSPPGFSNRYFPPDTPQTRTVVETLKRHADLKVNTKFAKTAYEQDIEANSGDLPSIDDLLND